MRLTAFSVQNYRSITHESELVLDDYTVLVGKNNEGKTNILRGLDLSLTAMGSPYSRYARGGPVLARHIGYDWVRDYPVDLQERDRDGFSKFSLTFELTREEANDMQDRLELGVPLTIVLSLEFGRSESKFSADFNGRQLSSNVSRRVMRSLGKGLSSVYIPAVRTNRTAMGALERTISQRMRVLEKNDAYVSALKTVRELRQEELGRVSTQLIDALKVFLPNVRDVEIVCHSESDYTMRQYELLGYGDYEVFVNDGNMTSIEQKGDGIQSLMALAVLSGSGRGGLPTILIVEEPESHLHPGAIRQLQKVLRDISQNQGQVLISTHNPIFVRRENPSSNIIVETGAAKPAKSVKDIRDALGVSLADNLINAERIILVEGMVDRVFLERVLPWREPRMLDLLSSGKVAIKEMGGIDNLCYELIHLQGELCDFIVLHDNDAPGREQVDKAQTKGLIQDRLSQVVTASRCGCQTEIEDFLRPEFYSPILADTLGLAFDNSNEGKRNLGIMAHGKLRWSDRLRQICEASGISLDKQLLEHAKTVISEELRLYEGCLEGVFTEDIGFVDRLTKLLLST